MFIVLDQTRSRVYDVFGASVILFQFEGGNIRIITFVIEDVSLVIGLVSDLVKGNKEEFEDLNVVDCFCLVDDVVDVLAICLQC